MLVIYKDGNDYCVTSKTNYDSRIMDGNKVTRYKGFEDGEAVRAYLCKYTFALAADFIIFED